MRDEDEKKQRIHNTDSYKDTLDCKITCDRHGVVGLNLTILIL